MGSHLLTGKQREDSKVGPLTVVGIPTLKSVNIRLRTAAKLCGLGDARPPHILSHKVLVTNTHEDTSVSGGESQLGLTINIRRQIPTWARDKHLDPDVGLG